MSKIFSEIKRILKAIGFSWAFKLIWSMIKKYFYDVPHFGFKIAHYNFWVNFANSNLLSHNLNKYIKKKSWTLNVNFLTKKYSNFIESYKDKNIIIGENCKKIWVLWWQGIETAPDLVKICVNSIKKHNCGYEVVFLDKDNYKDYIDLPDYIMEKVEKGFITITHLSDIIRMALLKEYGGIWVDATMYFNEDVFYKFDNINLNSNYHDKYIEEVGNFEKRCGFFIGGKPNKLFNFCYDFFMEYHKDYKQLINYFLIDYAIYIAYSSFDECKNDINNINIHNNNVYLLTKEFNKLYDHIHYNALMKTSFFKLTWKLKFEKMILNKITNYGYFTNNNNIT